MTKKEYLTVSEFAAAAGISKQAVYQRIKGSLKPFVKVEQGQKFIDISALNYISENSDIKDFQSTLNNGVDSAAADNELLNYLMEQLKEKDNQLAEKDKQIAQLIKLNDQQQQLTLQAQNLLVEPSSKDNNNTKGEEDTKKVHREFDDKIELERLNREKELVELRAYKEDHEKGLIRRLFKR